MRLGNLIKQIRKNEKSYSLVKSLKDYYTEEKAVSETIEFFKKDDSALRSYASVFRFLHPSEVGDNDYRLWEIFVLIAGCLPHENSTYIRTMLNYNTSDRSIVYGQPVLGRQRIYEVCKGLFFSGFPIELH